MTIANTDKPIALCSDHAGYLYKKAIIEHLTAQGIATKDFGTYSADSCDYPDFAHPCAKAVESGQCYPGIALCGTGNGIAMTLNKHQGVRAALCWLPELATLAREHNDANILVMPARFITIEQALAIVDTFLSTPFSAEERHARRIAKIPVS